MDKNISNSTYSSGELSAVFSNLSRASEKQNEMEISELYRKLSDYYKGQSRAASGTDTGTMMGLLEKDLSSDFASANHIAAGDRGSLRALKWGEQVSRMMISLLKRLRTGSADFVAKKNIYVCDICGFIYLGEVKPEICPVCKVPNFKMTKIRREA